MVVPCLVTLTYTYCSTLGARSFGTILEQEYSIGIGGICVLLGAIPLSEWTEYHSIHSAPYSWVNRMKEYGYSEYPEYAFFWEIFSGKSYAAARACAEIVVLRSPLPWVFRFQKKRSFQNWNSMYTVIPKPELRIARIVPKECTLNFKVCGAKKFCTQSLKE